MTPLQGVNSMVIQLCQSGDLKIERLLTVSICVIFMLKKYCLWSKWKSHLRSLKCMMQETRVTGQYVSISRLEHIIKREIKAALLLPQMHADS